MEQLPGFQQHIRHSPLVYKLNKAIYGLKQAPQAWFERLQQFRFSIGLFPLKLIVHCFFESLISQLRFEDIVITSSFTNDIQLLTQQLNTNFS